MGYVWSKYPYPLFILQWELYLSQYLATVIIRGVVRTLSIMIELFAKIGNRK